MDQVTARIEPRDMKIAHSSVEAMVFKPGRRSWINYRDLGVGEASKGAMSAEIMHIDDTSSSKPTGWHYHTSDMHFLYVVSGWVKIEFEGKGVTLLKEGDSIMVPGGVVHQELCSSEPFRLLEISVPAGVGTVPVEAPAWAAEQAAHYGEVEPVQNV